MKNCHLQSSFLRYAFSGVVAWLSVTLNVGLYPLVARSVKMSSNAAMMLSSVRFLIGFAKMAFVS